LWDKGEGPLRDWRIVSKEGVSTRIRAPLESSEGRPAEVGEERSRNFPPQAHRARSKTDYGEG